MFCIDCRYELATYDMPYVIDDETVICSDCAPRYPNARRVVVPRQSQTRLDQNARLALRYAIWTDDDSDAAERIDAALASLPNDYELPLESDDSDDPANIVRSALTYYY